MKKSILFVGAEVMPFAATGGLGDVLGSLPTALAAASLDVRVVMPLYSAVGARWRGEMKLEASFTVRLAWREQYCGVYSLIKDKVTYYFIDNEYYFAREALYGQYDDGERYAYFCSAVLEMLPQIGFFPDILHAHDWQAALSVIYLRQKYSYDARYAAIRRVFTIHNIEYQGKYDFFILGDVFALSEADRAVVEYGDCINLMKGAIECAEAVTTVSPRYADEIMSPEYSHGLYHILRQYANKVSGILNGIDYAYYNPWTDPVLAKHYSPKRRGGKDACRSSLRADLNLEDDKNTPVISLITRLASHKGLDIVAEAIRGILDETGAQLVVLGKGEAKYEEFFKALEAERPDKVRALITYDRDLSRRIYAATDIFMMPSKSEPCGLSQMIASRYGAIPVVRETGGLADSILPYWEDEDGIMHGNGFTFAGYTAGELYERTVAAAALWKDTEKRKAFVEKIMTVDFSWAASADKYIALYADLL
jgi:starch synthase